MSVNVEIPVALSVANGVTTTFPHAFTVLSPADLTVQGELNGVLQTYTLGTHYTLTGVGTNSGSVIFGTAPADGTIVKRFRNMSLSRATDYQDNGDMLADTVNLDFDRLWLAMQEIFYGAKGVPSALRAPGGETVAELPAAAGRAGYLLGFDGAGDPVMVPGQSGSATSLALDLASVGPSKGAELVSFVALGAGAAPRISQDKMREVVSAEDYGATGASTITDTAAINSAIAAVHSAGGGVVKVNAFISTAIDLSALTNYADVVLHDERYRAAGHIAYFNTGTDMEMRIQGDSLDSGEGPAFVVQNNAVSGDRTGSFVARWGPMGATRVNSYFHFGVWDGAAWTPDLDWLGNGNFGGADDFRSRLRLGAAGAAILNPAGTGKHIDAAAAKVAGYTLVINRPTPPGGGALQYQFGVKDGAVECPQEVQIFGASAAIRFQNVSQANKWAFVSEFPSPGQFTLYDHATGAVKQVWISGGDVLVAGNHAPTTDNAASSGKSSNRWSVIHAGTGTINTSDEREKDQISEIPDAWLDAWADVEWCRFKFREATQAKGDGARWHLGLVAQRVAEVFAQHGLDAKEIGLLCYDEWPEEWVDHPAVYTESGEVDETGEPTRVIVREAFREKVRDAGDRWGVRYEEALALEAALVRRRLSAIAQ